MEDIVMGMPIIEPSEITKCQAITDIIESVALQQAALAHILNAEGEKIQKVVAKDSTATTCEILKVNASVKSMVDSITKLEMILQFKLELFKKCLCDDCDVDEEE